MEFRKDINGLRAWAVVFVILFHFKVAGFGAGFFGVDIFFVISGFLMTVIIVSKLQNGNFSIVGFYLARFRRIVPALAVLITVLIVAGWFVLPTPEYQQLGTQSAYSLAFLSNVHFWRSSGYFDTIAQEKWLLHTWSLGVEMQFYMLFPIFLAILWRIKQSAKTLLVALAMLFFISLLTALIVGYYKPIPTFYLLPTRGWQMASGGIVYLISVGFTPSDQKQKLLFWLGVLLIASSFVVVQYGTNWSAGYALLPTIGAALVILSHSKSWLLTNPLAEYLGKISYSLYLWHWVFVVLLYYLEVKSDPFYIVLAITASVAFAHLSFVFVETPTRKGLIRFSNIKQIVLFAGVVGLIGVSAVAVRFGEYNGRLPADVEAVANEAKNINPKRDECEGVDKGCIYNGDIAHAIVIGDSHTGVTVTAFAESAKKHNLGIWHSGRGGCPTIRGLKRTEKDEECFEFNNWFLDQKIKELDQSLPIVLLSRTSVYAFSYNEEDNPKPLAYFDEKFSDVGNPKLLVQFEEALISTACELAQNRTVYLVRPIPEMGVDVPKTLSRAMRFGKQTNDIKITLDEYHKRHSFVWQAQDKAANKCGVKILNPLPYLCDEQFCYGSRELRPLYYDDDHLSEYGNRFLIPMFDQVFE